MALNDTFKIPLKKTTKLGADVTSNFHIKDYWEKECTNHPSKKECLFYCD